MVINRRLLPLKAHYFFYLGAMSPILPFIMVIVKQLGVPVVVQGTITFAVMMGTIFFKPLIGALVDTFPRTRKFFFLLLLLIMYLSFCSLVLLPPMHGHDEVVVEGILRSSYHENYTSAEILSAEKTQSMVLESVKTSGCFIQQAWDCKSPCTTTEFNESFIQITHLVEKSEVPANSELENSTERLIAYDAVVPTESLNCYQGEKLRFTCAGGNYHGSSCPSLFSSGVFIGYLLLYTLASIAFSASNSITDAVCMDTVGEGGDYGSQRAWGTVGWGLMGPIGGLLVDWWSRGSYGKNYIPIFYVVLTLGLIDFAITSIKLKVPRIETKENIWKGVGTLVLQPRFGLFLFFVILNGSFDGVIVQYIFILQEEMGANSIYMDYMKFIQGSTLFVQCFFEAPFMWLCAWFLAKLGASGVTKLVFFLYIFRLFGLALVGSYGPVWATLITELLNGPCYGLGYTAIVVQAAHLTPPGTSATVQSIVNICYESIGYAIASLMGGILKVYVGSAGIYYVFGCIASVTFILYIIADTWLSQLYNKYEPPKAKEDPSAEDTTESLLNPEKPVEIIGSSKPSDFPKPEGLIEVKDEHLA